MRLSETMSLMHVTSSDGIDFAQVALPTLAAAPRQDCGCEAKAYGKRDDRLGHLS